MRNERLQRLVAIASGPKAPDSSGVPVTAVTPVTGSLGYGSKPPQLLGLRQLRVENAGSPNRVFEAVTLPVTGSPVVPSDGWTDAHEERAAITEYEGGAPLAWAEGFARLDRARPPDDVPQRRWVQFVDDCGTFLDGGWAAKAEALGWGPLDLFGCDPAQALCAR
jgi:hypothetical protein